jgi:hypothetical protein
MWDLPQIGLLSPVNEPIETYSRQSFLTNPPKQKARESARNNLIRYLHYLLSTGQYRTFRYWKRSGEPNPFLKDKKQLEHTTRSEIDYLIKTRRNAPRER